MTSKFRFRFNKEKGSDEAEKDPSHLQLSGLRTEDTYSKGKGQDRDRMSEMPYKIRKKELTCSDM